MNFREYMDLVEGSVPALELGLPSVTRRSKIVGLRYRQGGVAEVVLADTTVVRLTTGQMKLVSGDPVVLGNTLTVVFQCHPGYTGRGEPQIMAIRSEAAP